MDQATIRQVLADDMGFVFDLVQRLLRELGEEGDEAGVLDVAALRAAWRSGEAGLAAFLAVAADGTAIGVVTVAEAFALYANGRYGIINEMYVAPDHRSTGVGALLIEAVKAHGRARGWRRVDVTAPESARWVRTRRFYETQGFTFAGPKLKCRLGRERTA